MLSSLGSDLGWINSKTVKMKKKSSNSQGASEVHIHPSIQTQTDRQTDVIPKTNFFFVFWGALNV
jgi:hypothetical protein